MEPPRCGCEPVRAPLLPSEFRTDYGRERLILQYKTFDVSTIDQAALDEGVIKGFLAIYGNRDSGGDRLVLGAARKSISERGHSIPIGYQHDLTDPLGRWTLLKEVSRTELPAQVLAKAPEATGGLYGEGRISMNAKNRDRLISIKDGTIPGLSIGYEVMQETFVKDADGARTRELKEIRLWEASCVTLAMNEAAMTTYAKAALPISENGTHGAFTGTHSHAHQTSGDQSADDTHDHSHTHDGNGEHGHPHEKAAVVPVTKSDGDESADVSKVQQTIALVTDLITDEVGELDSDTDECTEVYQLLQIRSMLVSYAGGEASDTAAMAMMANRTSLATKAGRRNSRPDEGKLKAAHDHLHDVLNIPHHTMAGAPVDAEDAADGGRDEAAEGEKAAMAVRMQFIQARMRAAQVGAA